CNLLNDNNTTTDQRKHPRERARAATRYARARSPRFTFSSLYVLVVVRSRCCHLLDDNGERPARRGSGRRRWTGRGGSGVALVPWQAAARAGMLGCSRKPRMNRTPRRHRPRLAACLLVV